MKKLYTIKELKNPAGTWLLGVILSLLVTGLLAPAAVWLSLDINDTLYENRQKQRELDKRTELSHKLEIEHARLLSPYELKKKAEIIGMGLANANQVRRITVIEENELVNSDTQNISEDESSFIEIGINEELEQELQNGKESEEDLQTFENPKENLDNSSEIEKEAKPNS